MRCENSMKIQEILRLNEMGCPQTQIKQSVKCARSTVGEILKRSKAIGLTYDLAKDMTTEEITELLYPTASKRYFKPEPDFEYIYNELKKHPKLNIRFCGLSIKSKIMMG